MRQGPPKLIVFLILAFLVATIAVWMALNRKPATIAPWNAPVDPAERPDSQPSGAQTATQPVGGTEARLKTVAGSLIQAAGAVERVQALEALRRALESGATNEVSAAIRLLLDSRTDAPTGLQFKIGGKGLLAEAPTLRTFLLDQLGRIDPSAAADYARLILNDSNSPDEWAVALRNLARGDVSLGARTLLADKTAELLNNELWQQDPSVGFLEAFDTAVFLGGTSLLPALSDLVREKDNRAVAHAAFLTLDRLVINQPAEVLSAIEQHPDWMQGREETRANYFARADLGDEGQRRLIESYLLDPNRGATELQAFAGVFPNANFMISQNLLTDPAMMDGATLARRDKAALAVVEEWLAERRFEKVKPELQKIRSRLVEFTK